MTDRRLRLVCAAATAAAAAPPPRKAKPGSFKEVGHDPLMSRGMNAAIAIHGDYAYIGSRTDGGHQGQPHGGILVVDIDDPADPDVVNRSPYHAKPGESSRE